MNPHQNDYQIIQQSINEHEAAKINIEKGELNLNFENFSTPGLPTEAKVNIIEVYQRYLVREGFTRDGHCVVAGADCITHVTYEYNGETCGFSFFDNSSISDDGTVHQFATDFDFDIDDLKDWDIAQAFGYAIVRKFM